MITLNIIPRNIKKEIKINFIYSIIKKNTYLFIIFFSLLGIIFITSDYILESRLAEEILNASHLNSNKNDGAEKFVIEVNKKLSTIENIQKNNISWSKVFIKISKIIPEEVKLSSLNINTKTSKINFRGVAKTRDSLLEIKDSLESDSIFSKLDFPIQNILQKENINFDISAIIDIYEIN